MIDEELVGILACPETGEPVHAADQELISVLTERYRAVLPSTVDPGDDRIDLNRASFEDLRALGISVSQAGRVVSRREAYGGFASVDELDGIFGFSAEQLEEFKRLVRV